MSKNEMVKFSLPKSFSVKLEKSLWAWISFELRACKQLGSFVTVDLEKELPIRGEKIASKFPWISLILKTFEIIVSAL